MTITVVLSWLRNSLKKNQRSTCLQSCQTESQSILKLVTIRLIQREDNGVIPASKHSPNILTILYETVTYKGCSEAMKSLSNSMESTRHFLREETHHATCISISISSFIKISVKREIYLCTIGRFHKLFGKRWRRRKKLPRRKVNLQKSSSSSWTLR